MEILNQGSFVPLDNRERVEQLKFTAKEMATEVAKSEGFENNGSTNQQIALEMWKGTEYLCRDHEQNTVRNIFLSSFLERLRELANATRVQPPPVQSLPPTFSRSAPTVVTGITSSPVAPVTSEPPPPTGIESFPQLPNAPAPDVPSPAEATDESLGIVPSIDDTPPESFQVSYDDECDPGYDAAIEAIVDRFENEEPAQDASGSSETAVTKDEPVTAAVEVTPQEEATSVAGEEVPGENAEVEAQVEPSEVQSIGSIVLSEKEPYNFDSCTLTSVIQLLPEDNGVRKCVVSIRSHDFVPQITIYEVANGNLGDDIKRDIEAAFEQYRTILPVLAAEKVKKDKPAAKKRTAKPADKTKAASKTVEPKDSTAAQAVQNSEAAQGQNSLFAS
ncbi:MAG: hypothetical protein AB7F88_00550 [Pyrinomonadaceae bacterium]